MSREPSDAGRVIITRNDLQARIKKPFDLNLAYTQSSLAILFHSKAKYTLN